MRQDTSGPCLRVVILKSAAEPLLGIPFGTQLIQGAYDWVIPMRPLGAFLFLALTTTLMLAAGVCLLFAPHATFARARAAQSVSASLAAVHGSVGAFLVFMVTLAVLMLLAIMAFVLGFLILIPVLTGAVKAAYGDVFLADRTGPESLAPNAPDA